MMKRSLLALRGILQLLVLPEGTILYVGALRICPWAMRPFPLCVLALVLLPLSNLRIHISYFWPIRRGPFRVDNR